MKENNSGKNIKIGCIGLGNMGFAIINGLNNYIKNNKINYTLNGYDINEKQCQSVKENIESINIYDNVLDLAHDSDIIFLAVKPNIIKDVAKSINDSLDSDKLILSIAAGISLNTLHTYITNTKRIIRCMPNTPCLIGKGITAISTYNASNSDIEIAFNLLSSLGKVVQVDEKNMDAVTALSGSGPAYVYTFIQALTDAGVKVGLSRDISQTLAIQTILGSSEMVLKHNNPIKLRGNVTSPGGTTIDAVFVLERNGFSGIVMEAVDTAYSKSKKLGDSK